MQFDMEQKEQTAIKSLDLSYPFWITEDHNGFAFYSRAELKALFNSFLESRLDNDDYCYTNLYMVDEDFRSNIPGKDSMGMLRHWHIENYELGVVEESGIEALWQ
ncbi:hypothetical protein DU002_09140 [Corallincola holothuriorum]|uniref:Uncharacterized protein n=2 Tax=Corallincola holothuriorum TaxID=2282215 RepID=A0A368NL21_9GAMM|nr:hypothetical protein DU002_09140 [Corallincola holothuriorum]